MSELTYLPPAPAYGYERAQGGLEESVDVVVVGTGPGGASCGYQLAKAGAKVLFLEMGPPLSRFELNQGAAMRYHMQEGGAMVARGNAYVGIAAGQGVGGGSLINSAICWRAPDEVLDKWSELLDDPGISSNTFGPIYDDLEGFLGVNPTPDTVAGENNRLIVRGVQALGYDGGLLSRNTPGCSGAGICYFGCPVGGKNSTNRNFLPLATQLGAVIQADTKVEQLLLEGGRVVGVRARARNPDSKAWGGTVTVKADKIVLAGGGIGTPRLLHQSGLAKSMGPMVGQGLHIHPGSAVMGLCDHEVAMWRGATQAAYYHPPGLPGVLPHTFSAGPEVCLGALASHGWTGKDGIAMLPYLCGLIVMVSDTGSGTVGATSKGSAKLKYHFADSDIMRIKAGMVDAARVLLAGGAHTIFTPVHGVGLHKSAESLQQALTSVPIADFVLYAAHPMSTCRMGRDPNTSVIRSDGRSHSYEGLYLSDASVFPTSLGVNPQLTVMAMGTHLGRTLAR